MRLRAIRKMLGTYLVLVYSGLLNLRVEPVPKASSIVLCEELLTDQGEGVGIVGMKGCVIVN